tara:strand:- start:333 stop:1259 length:927 start_codon:yes stop_codon:yes gene_type:complete
MDNILQGNVLERVMDIPNKSVQCVVTSPPYWGLRNYGEEDQLGLESTPEEYTDNMVKVFRGVRDAMKDDGTLWLNIGDSYASSGQFGKPDEQAIGTKGLAFGRAPTPKGLKVKDLVGIPWKLAFALQKDGWYLRQDIIWAKGNPMPESVKDRCTKSHEYIFLLTKSPRYYYDYKAIAEKSIYFETDKRALKGRVPHKSGKSASEDNQYAIDGVGFSEDGLKNKRSVWNINTKPSNVAHFAVFPEKIPELCIKAGSKIGDTVLDPFFGSGTTGWVAQRLQRKWIGIELNPEYVNIAKQRFVQQDMFAIE